MFQTEFDDFQASKQNYQRVFWCVSFRHPETRKNRKTRGTFQHQKPDKSSSWLKFEHEYLIVNRDISKITINHDLHFPKRILRPRTI